MKYSNKIISIIIMILFNTYLISCSQSSRNLFGEEKEIIDKSINSMLLANYIRKQMLKVLYSFFIKE